MKPIHFSIALACLPVTIWSQGAMSTDGARTSRPAQVKPRLIPFFQMQKECGFPILRADKAFFNEMESTMIVTTKAMNLALPVGTKVVQLSYGYKGSGVGSIYMAKKQKSVTAEQGLKPLIDKKIFKDRQYFKGWLVKPVAHPTLLVLVSGTSPEVQSKLAGTMK